MVKTEKLWKCPKCKRIFRRNKQQHSCAFYPAEKHFEGKAYAKKLYGYLKSTVRKKVGPFTVESLPCCIHFVNKKAYTFAAVFALKDRIRIHLASEKEQKSSHIKEFSKMSSFRCLYSIDIKDKTEIDAELVRLLKQVFCSSN